MGDVPKFIGTQCVTQKNASRFKMISNSEIMPMKSMAEGRSRAK